MSYAVMQTEPEPPSPEQLKNAFKHVPGLTAIDVGILGKDAFGVLVKGLDLDQASAMRSALVAQGVETEVVQETALAELPPPKQLTKVELTPEAFMINDVLGRSSPLAWKDILVIAAGRVRLTEFKTEVVDKTVMKLEGRHFVEKVVTETVTLEEQKDHLLLEIIPAGSALRYRAVADRPEARLLFQCLGERRTRDPATNLLLLVQELAKFAPDALPNHGAYYMCEKGDPSFSYPSQTAFYREITWLLWMVSSGRVQR
jgi:hypothetical protein